MPLYLLLSSPYLLQDVSTTPVPYSFAADEAETATLSIVSGNPGFMLIYVV
jgi:hypothetical protein